MFFVSDMNKYLIKGGLWEFESSINLVKIIVKLDINKQKFKSNGKLVNNLNVTMYHFFCFRMSINYEDVIYDASGIYKKK